MTARRILLTGLLAATLGLAAGAAEAQSTANMSVAPLPAGSPPPAQTTADPPSRVGRLTQLTGTVSFHTSDESQWEAATPNYPITTGNSLWTEPQAHAAVDIGSSRVYLDSQTELDIATLNDQGFQAQLPRGAVFLRVGSNDGPFEIDTPRGSINVNQPGNYQVVAGDSTHPTTVTALDGSAQVAGPGVNMTVAAGQTVQLNGQNPVTGTSGPAQQDAFTNYVAGIEQPYSDPAPQQQLAQRQTTQYVSPGMTGYQDLGQYGQWQQTPDYGPIWTPTVAVDWAPYRYGHWAYILPWGWTWIDDSPWGFTPFHYGRWIQIGNRWSWCPGAIVAQPVYAPALVGFFGDPGIGINIGFGPSVGWIPLGPGEVWYPPYRFSPRYVRNLNITNVNITNINIYNNRPIGNFMNRRGATFVTTNVMANSLPVGRGFHPVPAGAWQGTLAKLTARNEVPVRPTLRTAGLTPVAARQFGEALPVNGQFPGRAVTPGPQVSANQSGIALANGRRLPAFAQNTQPNVQAQNSQAQKATAALLNNGTQFKQQQGAQQGGGRVITLGNAGNNAGGQQNGQMWAGQNLGSFKPQGQTQLKAAAPGPAIQPHNNTTNRGFANLGNTGTSQNGSARWSFLPPLQKSGQAGSQSGSQNGGQAGFQGSGFASSWQKAETQPKTQGQNQAKVTIIPGGQMAGQGQNAVGFGNANNQRWANSPAQTQNRQFQTQSNAQTQRNGQTTWKGQTAANSQKSFKSNGNNFSTQQRQTFQAQQQRQAANLFQNNGAYSFQQRQQQQRPQQQQKAPAGANKPLLNQKQPGGN